MNDLPFIFYDARKMLLDTFDMSCEAERAHRRLCDYVWVSDRAPLCNNESLRQITQTKESDWGRVKRELLAKGWVEVGEYLLHRGVIKTLNESKQKYVDNYNRQCKMNRQQPLKLSTPDSVTGIVTFIVTSTVAPAVKGTVEGLQEQRQEQQEIVKEETVASHPLAVQVKTVFDEWNNQQVLPKCLLISDKRRRMIEARLREPFFTENWLKAMQKCRILEFCLGNNDRGWRASFDWFIQRDVVAKIIEGKYDAVASNVPKNDGRSSVIDKVLLKRNLDDLEGKLRALEGGYESHQSWPTSDISERKRLKGLIADIKSKLGMVK
jgi:hypothetical protein